jgi:hypothetical protein
MAKRRRRRRSGGLTGAAVSAKRAPVHCKKALSSCMKGGGGKAKASHCMKRFNACKR